MYTALNATANLATMTSPTPGNNIEWLYGLIYVDLRSQLNGLLGGYRFHCGWQ